MTPTPLAFGTEEGPGKLYTDEMVGERVNAPYPGASAKEDGCLLGRTGVGSLSPAHLQR